MKFDTLINRILVLSEQQPDVPALIFKKDNLTYKELAEKIVIIGNALNHMGVKRGDRVLFTALSKPEMAAVYLGIQYCGAVAVFMDKNSTPENAASIYRDAEAVLFLTDKPMGDYQNELHLYSLKKMYLTEKSEIVFNLKYMMPDETDMAEMLFTTGTTGTPKGVVLSYGSVYDILSNTIEGIGIRTDERILLPLPLNHSFALRVLRAALYQGATVVLQNGFAFAREVEDNQKNFHCTAMAAVPASMEILRSQMQDKFEEVLGKFRYIEIGAGSLTIEQRKRLSKQLPNTTLYNTWGSSESGGALFVKISDVVNHPEQVSTIGKPLSCVQVKVLDENGKEIVSDKEHPGRMALKGDMKMAGYWHREELTRETLKDGWLLTNDMVYTDQDGYVYMLGRADDIINVGGEKVSPIEVENIAGEYEGIRECACIGVEDPKKIMGQVPILIAVVKNTFTESGLQSFLSDKMERYKLPQYILQVSELPRNRMGKLDRKSMKKLWEQQGKQELMNPVMQALLTRRSIRRFESKPIPEDILNMILKAGYYAPTGHNLQTWRFTVIQKQETIAQLRDTIKKVAKEKRVNVYGFEEPPCIILISNDRRNINGCQDASCAAENIFLAAHSYGIGSVWLNPLLTLCDEPLIRELLDGYGIPGTHIVWCIAALGYAVADGTLLAKKKDVVFYVDK